MNREEAKKLAEELVSRMTIEEKASQLRYDSPAIDRLGVPEFNWWNEGLHGVARGGTATGFPQAIAMAAMFDDELLEKIADVVSTEARAKYNAANAAGDVDKYKGLTLWSPNINIFRDPRWGRGHETYGEDPYLTGRLGRAFVRGLQGKGDTLKTTACAKHYAVHSGPEETRHYMNAEATLKDMYETYLPAFHDLVEEKVEAVMGCYNRVNGEPACGSHTLLVDILRDKWGFEGHVVSDCWAIRDFHEGHKVTSKPTESVRLALENGCDLNCGCTYEHILKAYEEGMIPEEWITRSAVRVFTARYLLGVMGNGSEYDSIPYSKVECREHIELSQKAARQSCVLLKNNGILPINKSEISTIGVIGPNANSRIALMGNYHGTSSRYITVLEGIQDYVGEDCRVMYSEGCHLFRDRVEVLAKPSDRLTEAIAVANNSDRVVLVLGLDETLEGEEGDTGNAAASGDKLDLLLPEPQRELARRVLAVGKPTIIILLAGSSIDISEYEEKADAVLMGWYPGPYGGKAIAEILFGDVSPSGKLPVTFYYNHALEEMPVFEDYSMQNRTYRYYQGKPYHPFGYGLTYGKTEVLSCKTEGNTATVEVVNRGTVDTDDVVELFVRDNESPLAPPNPVLCGFQRVHLKAGEQKSLDISIGENAFTVVDENGDRIPGSGNYTIFATFNNK